MLRSNTTPKKRPSQFSPRAIGRALVRDASREPIFETASKSSEHMPSYLDESIYRFSRRNQSRQCQSSLLSRMAPLPKCPYSQLLLLQPVKPNQQILFSHSIEKWDVKEPRISVQIVFYGLGYSPKSVTMASSSSTKST